MIKSVVVAVVVMMMLEAEVVMMIILVVLMMMIQDYISSNGFPECKQSINAKVNSFRAKYLFSISIIFVIRHSLGSSRKSVHERPRNSDG